MTHFIHELSQLPRTVGDEIVLKLNRDKQGIALVLTSRLAKADPNETDPVVRQLHAAIAKPLFLRLDSDTASTDAQIAEALTTFRDAQRSVRDALGEYEACINEAKKTAKASSSKKNAAAKPAQPAKSDEAKTAEDEGKNPSSLF